MTFFPIEEPMRFDHFMHEALYHPEQGYYTQGQNHIGKKGDFFTSVSVGPLFGQLLAHRFYLTWLSLEKPHPFSIIELGANDGTLASDIIHSISQDFPDFAEAFTYTILEPLEKLRSIQRTKTEGNVKIVSSTDEITPCPGIVFGNELLDAFPVRLVIQRNKQWNERYVSQNHQGELEWHDLLLSPQPSDLPNAADYPDEYQTEWQTLYTEFFDSIKNLITKGTFLFIDYGKDSSNYYTQERRTGTLKTFHQHKLGENPLTLVGEQDITYDVNFSAVAQACLNNDLTPSLFTDQATALTSLSIPLLKEIEKSSPSAETLHTFTKQFHTLTHPTHMGTQFYFFECTKDHIERSFLFNPLKNKINSL